MEVTRLQKIRLGNFWNLIEFPYFRYLFMLNCLIEI